MVACFVTPALPVRPILNMKINYFCLLPKLEYPWMEPNTGNSYAVGKPQGNIFNLKRWFFRLIDDFEFIFKIVCYQSVLQ